MDSILIIDDEPQIRKLLSRMMELEGYEVFQAADCQRQQGQSPRRQCQGQLGGCYPHRHCLRCREL